MNYPRVIIAGTHSGGGKTTATCAILALLKRRGTAVGACKCGPDYIDPTFHTSVLGVPSANLDPFFCDDGVLARLLIDNAGADVTVIEGVMGYYDGTGENGADNSTYSVARRTDTPAVLVVDAKGASASALAVIEGFVNFVPDSLIAGVLFNRVKKPAYERLAAMVEKRFGGRVKPVGFIPPLPDECVIGSRRLGLITAGEIADLGAKTDTLADLTSDTVDLDAITGIASRAGELHPSDAHIEKRRPVKIAAAKDAAFCFYYADTLKLFEKLGAEIVYFSPLADEPVPEDARGLLLGGGYPELYAETLENNRVAASSVRRAFESGMPIIAECGGFQYLGVSIDGKKMCGAIESESANAGKLTRFGYVTLEFEKSGLFGGAGVKIPAHEFHYYDCSDPGGDVKAVKANGREYRCAFCGERLYAGYPHLFLPANPAAAAAFYEKCLEFNDGRV